MGTLEDHEVLVKDVLFVKDGKKIVSADSKTIRIWDSKTYQLLKVKNLYVDYKVNEVTYSIESILVATGEKLIAGTADSKLVILDMSNSYKEIVK